MNATHSIYKSERGAALLIALFVLVIVSVTVSYTHLTLPTKRIV